MEIQEVVSAVADDAVCLAYTAYLTVIGLLRPQSQWGESSRTGD
jgi:hypothetical protein